MEITKRARFITDFYGSAPCIGAQGVLEYWLKDKIGKSLLTFAQQQTKKGEDAEGKLMEILSIFHRDQEGYPVLGSWMLRRCLVNTGLAIFNAQKNKNHPKKDTIPMGVNLVEPLNIRLTRNRNEIDKPDLVTTYAVTITKPSTRSFFKAYECINAGAEFEFTAYFDEELLGEENINFLLAKAGQVGVGAFRERFGKFVMT